MNIINEFLKSTLNADINEEIITSTKMNVNKINSLFANTSSYKGFLRLLPKIKQNQIWTIKKQYVDYEGEMQKASHPMMVIVVSDIEELDSDTSFVRVCPISPFVEMGSAADQICSDSSIIGFPFLIESWNEQPILTEILDKYVADFYLETEQEEVCIDDDIREFREIEISNARFLNHSIVSYTNEMEKSNNFSFSVDLRYQNYAKTIHMPIMNVMNPMLLDLTGNEEYASAAKMGHVITENDYIEFNNTKLPFQLKVRKKSGRFVITIIPKMAISLYNDKNEIIEGSSNSERIVYENLKKGLYQIQTPLVNELITIRLK